MRQNQKGAIQIVIIAIVLVIAGLGYYLFSQGKLASLLPTTQRATEKDFEFIEDATLRKHFIAQANKSAYRTKTTSDAADLTFIMEVQIKGEDFNTRNIEQDSSGAEKKHKIQLGDTTYIKDFADNKWWKQTIKSDDIPEGEKDTEPLDFKEEYLKPDLKFKELGKETCGDLTCFKYEQLNGGQEGLAFKRMFWFDDQEFLLRKDEVTVGEFTNTVEYTYDNVNIVAPSPTKDVPEGKSIYDYYYGTTTPTKLPTNYNPKEYSLPTLPDTSPSQKDTGY